MPHQRWLILALPIFVSACRTPSQEAKAGASTITAANATTPSGPSAGQAERMPHCPSVVAGATTLVNEVPDGVELRVTAAETGATEIRKRATFLATAASETQGKHRANGGGGGQFGRCPVVMRNTKVEATEIAGGASITVKPSDPVELEWLRHEVEARAAQISAPRAFGQGLMKLCPSAVPNSMTKVVDTPYGVDVIVIETSLAGTRSIRERAKALVAHGPTLDERCAASVPDATLVASDTPGGTTIAIKAKRPADVALLRRAVRERAQSYAAPMVR